MSAPFLLFSWDKAFLPDLARALSRYSQGRLGDCVVIVPHNRPRRYLKDILFQHPDIARPTLMPRILTMTELVDAFRNQEHSLPLHTAGDLDRVALLYQCMRDILHGDAPAATNADANARENAGATHADAAGAANEKTTGASATAPPLHDGATDFTASADLCRHFAAMDMAHFLPWGLRLADIVEECLNQNTNARDLLYTDDEVAPAAAALLSVLGTLQRRYMKKLQENAWTTPGLDAYTAARSTAPLPPLLQAKHVFIAGFSALSNTENILLRRLWDAGAHICLHTDPRLADPTAHAHWACEDHSHWVRRWKAQTRLFASPSGTVPRMEFTAGFDVHSQLLAMRELLQKNSTSNVHANANANANANTDTRAHPPTTAIVLANDSLLMPVLHHLPDADFNVSMGYPLERGALCRLVETILRLHTDTTTIDHSTADADESTASACGAGAAGNGGMPITPAATTTAEFATAAPIADIPAAPERRLTTCYHWRALLHCLRHPYWRLLQAEIPPDQTAPNAPPRGAAPRTREGTGRNNTGVASALTALEHSLRRGTRFVRKEDVYAVPWPADIPSTPEQRALLHEILDVIFRFGQAYTPRALGDALYALCSCLRRYGTRLWQSYPLDAEGLYRMVQHVVPELQNSALADTPFSLSTLHGLLRQLLHAQRIPFEADPLTALQVLGMLETRLLHFDRLIILDANDDALPGFSPQDPLLPDALRPLLGLPNAHRRERIAAHNLFRLVAGADEVHFYWQQGVQHSGLFDGKKSRSRFVEECLWQVEKNRGTLLKTGTPPLHAVDCSVQTLPHTPTAPLITPSLREHAHALLRRGISPTRLDSYLQCPARFAWENLYNFRIVQEVNEGDDPAALGTLLHQVMQDAYKGYIGHTVITDADGRTPSDAPNTISAQRLKQLFATALADSQLQTQLPPDKFLFLSAAAPMRLQEYVRHQPHSTQLIAVEQKMYARLDNTDFCLVGTLDRIDKRGDSLMILDYKTGTVHKPAADAWEHDIWDNLTEWDGEETPSLLHAIADVFPSVQLPCYLYMCARDPLGQHTAPGNAAWIPLGKDGKEVPLLPLLDDEMDDDTRTGILQGQIPLLLDFLLRHLAADTTFAPRSGEHCRWCPFTGLCRKETAPA